MLQGRSDTGTPLQQFFSVVRKPPGRLGATSAMAVLEEHGEIQIGNVRALACATPAAEQATSSARSAVMLPPPGDVHGSSRRGGGSLQGMSLYIEAYQLSSGETAIAFFSAQVVFGHKQSHVCVVSVECRGERATGRVGERNAILRNEWKRCQS